MENESKNFWETKAHTNHSVQSLEFMRVEMNVSKKYKKIRYSGYITPHLKVLKPIERK